MTDLKQKPTHVLQLELLLNERVPAERQARAHIEALRQELASRKVGTFHKTEAAS
jgi:hypothetical protein